MGAGPAAALPSGLVPLILLEPLPTVAAKNKSLAKNNKSRTGREATKKPIRRSMGIGWALIAMTLQEAKSIARHLGLTLRKVRSGDYRVNFRDGNEMTAYYTDNLEDAVNTAVEMIRKRTEPSSSTHVLWAMIGDNDE
jgi:hypothetical protein